MELQYTSEHTGCVYYATEDTSLFRTYRLEAGERLPELNRSTGSLLYVVEGSLETEGAAAAGQTAEAGRLLFLSQGEVFRGRAAGRAVVLTCGIPFQITFCASYGLSDLRRDVADVARSGAVPAVPVVANDRLRAFFAGLLGTFADGLNCVHYHELKRKELFILLRAYYTKEELYGLFRAILEQNNEFKQFILQYYREAEDVNGLAALANMSVRNFQRKFKAEFSCSVRDWLLARKAEAVLHELRSTDKELMSIAVEHGFSAMSYFTTFCKRNLGMTPSELRGHRSKAEPRPLGPCPATCPARVAKQ